MKTLSQVVQETLVTVKAQMARTNTTHASTDLIVRHATKHAATAEPGIIGTVCEAVRDELYYERIGHGRAAPAIEFTE